jgi:hypothetical protein
MTTKTKRAGTLALAAALVFGAASTRAWARSTPVTEGASDPARAFLRVDLGATGGARRELFVGETVPVTIRAYFLGGTGASLTGQPHLTSDGLMLSDLSDKPAQSATQLRGMPYTVLTWTGRLTAARAGEARTDVELPVELSYLEPPRGLSWPDPTAGDDSAGDDSNGDDDGDASDDPLSSILKNSPLAKDPFFARAFKGGDPFAGMMRDLGGTLRRRQVTLSGPGSVVKVLALPTPQPAGFTGAVGSFEVAAALSGGPYRVGEPATLRLTVKGRGTFSRLSVAGAPSAPQLTTYATTEAGSPRADGEKVFTQTVVPRRTGEITIPPVGLTYFDPRARRYVTRQTTPIHIDVGAAAGEAAPVALPGAANTTARSGAGAAPRASGVPASDLRVPDVVRRELTPFIYTRRAPILLGVLVVAAAALVVLGRLRRGGALARRRAARQLAREVARQLRQSREAARRGDAAALFGAGRRALQARLAAVWGMPAEAIGAIDVAHRLGPRGAQIREIFERADRVSYAGTRATVEPDLEHWPERISVELRNLESSR